jgi:hypothetical protein
MKFQPITAQRWEMTISSPMGVWQATDENSGVHWNKKSYERRLDGHNLSKHITVAQNIVRTQKDFFMHFSYLFTYRVSFFLKE